jgi:hypothetical protein
MVPMDVDAGTTHTPQPPAAAGRALVGVVRTKSIASASGGLHARPQSAVAKLHQRPKHEWVTAEPRAKDSKYYKLSGYDMASFTLGGFTSANTAEETDSPLQPRRMRMATEQMDQQRDCDAAGEAAAEHGAAPASTARPHRSAADRLPHLPAGWRAGKERIGALLAPGAKKREPEPVDVVRPVLQNLTANQTARDGEKLPDGSKPHRANKQLSVDEHYAAEEYSDANGYTKDGPPARRCCTAAHAHPWACAFAFTPPQANATCKRC